MIITSLCVQFFLSLERLCGKSVEACCVSSVHDWKPGSGVFFHMLINFLGDGRLYCFVNLVEVEVFVFWCQKFGLLSEARSGRRRLCDWSKNRSCIWELALILRLCVKLGLGHLIAVGVDWDVLAVVVSDGALGGGKVVLGRSVSVINFPFRWVVPGWCC